MSKNLSQFITAQPIIRRVGEKDPIITDLVYDSRSVTKGSLFFAQSGTHTTGEKFISDAISNGAVAIIHEKELAEYQENIVYLQVENPRIAMSPLAASFYDYPSKHLGIIGVTGTEGKSTTVSLIFQLLRMCGKKTGFISTVEYCLGDEIITNPEHQTTPEATIIHKLLNTMRENGVEYAVVESSSHGLSLKTSRLADVLFDAGIMTNVTHEHLEFHGSREQYKNDKANLFRALDAHDHIKNGKHIPSFGIVNEEDSASQTFRGATNKPVYGFSTWADCTKGLSASEIESDPCGVTFKMTGCGVDSTVRIAIPGSFNVYNTLAATLAVSRILEKPVQDLLTFLPLLLPVRGRMTIIDEGQNFEVLVDYAHTPSSFLAILPPLEKRITGNIICLFGSGGERDTIKRAEQGRIACHYADIIILTDEDPRKENPLSILEMIAEGCTNKVRGENLFLIPSRPQAIRHAFSLAKENDAVLLLGKGHENSIMYADHTVSYDEIAEAKKALHEAGWRK